MATMMQEPFPVLTDLDIWSKDGNVPVLPAKFLGGSAPRLQAIFLHGVPFPSLPTLLLSTGDLVKLDLRNIPPTGYISPEAMVVGLTALPRLKLFIIEFQSATPHPDRIQLAPVTRGASEYLEDLAGRIDSPQLSQISAFYLDPPDNFQVAQFCKRSPSAQPSIRATLLPVFHLNLKVSLEDDRQLEYTENVEWLYLLHQFPAVQTLHVSRKIARHVALALKEGGMFAEVLPSLGLICLAGQPSPSIKRFVTARRLSAIVCHITGTDSRHRDYLAAATISDSPVSPPSFVESLTQIGSPSVRPLSLPGDPSSGATSHVTGRKIAQGGCKKQTSVRDRGESHRHAATNDMLPDNVLLEIFDFYRKDSYPRLLPWEVWNWHFLVHVCRRWRQVVFASPHRLHLRLLCTYGTPVSKNLDVWPTFPIVIQYRYSGSGITPDDEDSIIAALKHHSRVYYLGLDVKGSQWESMATVMQEPYPELTRLEISSEDGNAPVLSAEFLGGSAPNLQTIYLHRIPFPALPTLLLSASDLVDIDLRRIPPTGYISPEAIVACLAVLPRLDSFYIGFSLAISRPDRIHPSPVTRTGLLLSPTLDSGLVDFQVAHFSGFINRSFGPKLTQFKHAQVSFINGWVTFAMNDRANRPSWDRHPATTMISCEELDWQVSHVAQVLSQFSAILSNVVHLRLKVEPEGRELEGMEHVEWQPLLRPLSTVQTLHVSQELAGHIALTLEALTTEMGAEAFSSLDLIHLADQPASSIEKFVAAHRLSDRPVTFVDTEIEFDERVRSHVSQ
ncbi:hypothetical protein EDB87DRAFT_1680166 [Lactarius vividus]|nr:hypothetical protein EDB87DRAFT_1680166 [Lactarius vividus]